MIIYKCDKCNKDIKRSHYDLKYQVRINDTSLDPVYLEGELCNECACKLGSLIQGFFDVLKEEEVKNTLDLGNNGEGRIPYPKQ